MKSELRKRVETLETSKAAGEGLTAIVRTVVEPGPSGPQACAVRAFVGVTTPWRIERRNGEALPAFIRRAGKAAPRDGGIPRLMQEFA